MKELIKEYEMLIERLDKACKWLEVNNISDVNELEYSMPTRYNSYIKLISDIEQIQIKIHANLVTKEK